MIVLLAGKRFGDGLYCKGVDTLCNMIFGVGGAVV